MKTKLVEMHGQIVKVKVCPTRHAWAPPIARLREKQHLTALKAKSTDKRTYALNRQRSESKP